MTDADWLSCTTRPKAMLTAVRRRASGRKLQLLACGVCRLVWEHVPEPACRAAVAAAERFADGLLPADEFQAMARAAQDEQLELHTAELEQWFGAPPNSVRRQAAARAVLAALSDNIARSLSAILDATHNAACDRHSNGLFPPGIEANRRKVRAAQCDLFRELFPPPSRRYTPIITTSGPGVCLPGGQFFYPSEAARRLAESTVGDGNYDRLPILADALEEADCPDAELIHHLRHGTNHARGCWAIDAVLGRS